VVCPPHSQGTPPKYAAQSLVTSEYQHGRTMLSYFFCWYTAGRYQAFDDDRSPIFDPRAVAVGVDRSPRQGPRHRPPPRTTFSNISAPMRRRGRRRHILGDTESVQCRPAESAPRTATWSADRLTGPRHETGFRAYTKRWPDFAGNVRVPAQRTGRPRSSDRFWWETSEFDGGESPLVRQRSSFRRREFDSRYPGGVTQPWDRAGTPRRADCNWAPEDQTWSEHRPDPGRRLSRWRVWLKTADRKFRTGRA